MRRHYKVKYIIISFSWVNADEHTVIIIIMMTKIITELPNITKNKTLQVKWYPDVFFLVLGLTLNLLPINLKANKQTNKKWW